MSKNSPLRTNRELEEEIARAQLMIADMENFLSHLERSPGPPGSKRHQTEQLVRWQRELEILEAELAQLETV